MLDKLAGDLDFGDGQVAIRRAEDQQVEDDDSVVGQYVRPCSVLPLFIAPLRNGS